jgi:hypothetical protein
VRQAVRNEPHVGHQSRGEDDGGFFGNGTFGVPENLYGLRAHAGFLSLDQFHGRYIPRPSDGKSDRRRRPRPAKPGFGIHLKGYGKTGFR